MKGVLLVLVLCACVASTAAIYQFSSDDNNVKFILEMPSDVESTLSDSERAALTFSDDQVSYLFRASSYMCVDDHAGGIYNLIVDGDLFDRNQSQRVLFERVSGNKKVSFMSGPTILGSTISFIQKRPTTCYIHAWSAWKVTSDGIVRVMDVTYATSVGTPEKLPTRTISRGRTYTSYLPMTLQQYESAFQDMLQEDMSNRHTRCHARIIAQCGTFTQQELQQPAQPVFAVADVDYFYLQVCRLIEAQDAPPVEQTPESSFTYYKFCYWLIALLLADLVFGLNRIAL